MLERRNACVSLEVKPDPLSFSWSLHGAHLGSVPFLGLPDGAQDGTVTPIPVLGHAE